MDCVEIESGADYGDITNRGEAYTVFEPGDDEEIMNEDFLDTDLSQEILVHEIRKFVYQSVERREKRKSKRKQARKGKSNLLINDKGQNDGTPRPKSRSSMTYFCEVMKNVRTCERKSRLVAEMGFAELLRLDDCIVPRAFAKWLADASTFGSDDTIIIQNEVVLGPDSVRDTFAIPSGSLLCEFEEEEEGKLAFLAQFCLTDLPTVKYFGSMVINDEVPDDVFKRSFMVVTLATFLCPTSSTKPSTKYLGSLVNVENINNLNWCKFVHIWLVCYIKKYQKDKLKVNKISLTLGGCMYHMSVRYLDFVDFGKVLLPTTMPRIRVWKGDLIKHFSNMVIGRTGLYGQFPVKKFEETCYAASTAVDSERNFLERIDSVIGNYFEDKVKQDILGCVTSHMIEQSSETCLKIESVLIDVFKAIIIGNTKSGETLKIESSGEYKSCNNEIDSRTTEKVNSNSAEDDLTQAGNKNNKRSFQDAQQTTCSATSLINKRSKLAIPCPPQSRVILDLNEIPVESNEVKEDRADSTKDCATTVLENDFDVLPCDVSKGFENAGTSCVKSASLGHMVCQDDFVNKNECVSSNALLPVIIPEEGIRGSKYKAENNEIVGHGFESFLNPTGIESIACIAQQYASSDSSNDTSKSARPDFEELSKKYFFKEDGCPSFRLFDFVDDNGKTIDEPELWRPLDMTEDQYYKKIKEANLKALIPEKQECEKDLCDESIQCAQPQKSDNSLSNSLHENSIARKSVINIDSDSPENHISSDWLLTRRNNGNHNITTSTSSNNQISAFAKSGMVGRKLFTDSLRSEWDDVDDEKHEDVYVDEENMSPEVQYMGRNENRVVSNSPEVKFIGERLKQIVPESPEVQVLGERLKHDVPQSPEVQYLGELSFNNIYSNMSRASDDLYNAGLSLGNRSVSSGKENVAPKRIVQRSFYLCSPFDSNSSSNVNPVNLKLYDTITTLCDDPQYADMWVINMNNCRVTLKQLGCSMKPDGWVEAWLINACCKKMFKDIHPKKSNKHFFFHTTSECFLEKWPNEYIKEFWKKNVVKGFLAADSARKLHLSERLNFPSLYNSHWFLFSVDLKARKFLFMDSLLGPDSQYHEMIDDMMIKNFKNTWNECGLKDMNFDSFEKMFPKLPKQKTKNDCGVFLIKYMQKFCPRNPHSCSFSAKDVPEFRQEIAIDSMFNQHNSNLDEMEFIRSFDIEEYKRIKSLQ